ncbi:MAG: radical SAM protein [Selenomonadaceae bacterium]|nr:radical SAM protein [Selenomonadaceae bacterium]
MPQKMDIIKKLRQEFVINHLQNDNWKKNPLVVELDTTEICNFACPGCISEDLVSNRTSFSKERLMTLAQELFDFGVKAVILIGGGEPLAHPAAGELIKFFGTHDIKIGITTNGYFIPKYLDEIAEHADWTRVSMDAATAGTFGKLRPTKDGRSTFDSIVEAMRTLAKVKKGRLGFSFLIRTEADGFGITSNIAEIYDAARLAKDIGCDYFEIKPSYNYAGGKTHSLVRHSDKRMQEAKHEIDRLAEIETNNFKIITAINLYDSLNGVQSVQEKNYHFCPAAYLRTLICPSGVYVCPYWRGKKNFCIGDAKKDSIQKIWQSERRASVMQKLDPIEKCNLHCLRDETNKKIIELLQTERNEIDIVEEFDRFI